MEKKEVIIEADVLFEVSWEVCNKVGGIYTVVSSKVDEMIKFYGDNYFTIGPYFPEKVKGEFMELAPPSGYKNTCNKLKDIGIIVHYGKWLVGKRPTALLIDFQNFIDQIDTFKSKLWEEFGVDSLNSGFEFNEPLAWSQAAAILIREFAKIFPEKKIVAHLHEWLAGSIALDFKANNILISSVFTTHATVLGRTMTNRGIDIYSEDKDGNLVYAGIDTDRLAYEYNVHDKHQLEKACALNADVFTTVSEVTALETKYLLGKEPDFILPNGINIDKFPSRDDCSVQHVLFRDKIFRFLTYYFFPYYPLDFKHTHIYFIAARYELHDKGIDVFIRSLGNLNRRLKELGSKETVVAFIWVPADIRGMKPSLVENRTFFDDIESSVMDQHEHVLNRIITAIAAEKDLSKDILFPKESLDEIYTKVLRFRRKEMTPPVCTHDLRDQNDPIMKMLEEEGLQNAKEDNVKVIFYPIYLTGADGLLNLNYHEAIQGTHFGFFPSYYEPYGYTPLECGAHCVVALTTDLSGFGQLMQKLKKKKPNEGIYVLKRMGKEDDEIIADLSQVMLNYPSMTKKKRVENKFEARRLAELADWKILINNYIAAHNKAIQKRG